MAEQKKKTMKAKAKSNAKRKAGKAPENLSATAPA